MFKETQNLLKENRRYLYFVMIQVCFFSMCKELLVSLGLIGVLLSIFLMTASHAEVVAGLKVVRQQELEPEKDAYSGIKRIKELFSTYFMLALVNTLLAFVLGYIVSLFIFNTQTTAFWDEVFLKVQSEQQYGIQNTAKLMANVGSLVILLLSLLSDFIVKSIFFAAPYILETKQIRGLKALKEARNIIQGHYKEVFKMNGHYYVWMIFFSCLRYLIENQGFLLFLIPLFTIGLLLIEVHVYRMEYAIVKCQLFQKLTNTKGEI